MSSFHYIEDKKSRKAVQSFYYKHIKGILRSTWYSRKSKEMIKRNLKKLKYAFRNLFFSRYPHCFSKCKPKVAVYTVIFGNYDSLKTIRVKSNYCDYFVITDGNVPPECGWKKMEMGGGGGTLRLIPIGIIKCIRTYYFQIMNILFILMEALKYKMTYFLCCHVWVTK